MPAKAENGGGRTNMGGIGTFLSKFGQSFKKVFAVATPIEAAAAPFITAAFPGVGAAINLAFNTVAGVEASFEGSNINSQASAQKLATVVNTIEPAVIQLLAQEGIKADTPTVTNIVNAVVAVLNAIPAPTTTPTAPTTPATPTPTS